MAKLLLTGVDGNLGGYAADILSTLEPKENLIFYGYNPASLEKYAAMDYFAQYDYTRWASTNIQGPEFSAGYRFNKYLQMRARFFISNEIKGYYMMNPEYKKSEDRFRLDFNLSF